MELKTVHIHLNDYIEITSSRNVSGKTDQAAGTQRDLGKSNAGLQEEGLPC